MWLRCCLWRAGRASVGAWSLCASWMRAHTSWSAPTLVASNCWRRRRNLSCWAAWVVTAAHLLWKIWRNWIGSSNSRESTSRGGAPWEIWRLGTRGDGTGTGRWRRRQAPLRPTARRRSSGRLARLWWEIAPWTCESRSCTTRGLARGSGPCCSPRSRSGRRWWWEAPPWVG